MCRLYEHAEFQWDAQNDPAVAERRQFILLIDLQESEGEGGALIPHRVHVSVPLNISLTYELDKQTHPLLTLRTFT